MIGARARREVEESKSVEESDWESELEIEG